MKRAAVNAEVALPEIVGASVEERMDRYGVKKDRAEVIGIAALVFATVARQLGFAKLIAPGVGVREGLLMELAETAREVQAKAEGDKMLEDAKNKAKDRNTLLSGALELMKAGVPVSNDLQSIFNGVIQNVGIPLMMENQQMQQQIMEMQQQQMRPMFIYMIPSFMIWIFLFPTIFGGTVSLSPVFIPWIMCGDDSVQKDMQPRNQTDPGSGPTGPCRIPGEVYLWGWFLITSFGFSGIISKVTKTSMPSIT